MKKTVKDFVSIEKVTFISYSSSPLRHYLWNMWNSGKWQSDCEAMIFCGTFRKNIVSAECAAHLERYIMPASV